MQKIRVYRKYPQAVRDRVVKRALEGDKITSELSQELDIPVHLINRWKRDYLAEQADKEDEARAKEAEQQATEAEAQREAAKLLRKERAAELRDRFALEALQPLIADRADTKTDNLYCVYVARSAYEYADAMMAERAKRKHG